MAPNRMTAYQNARAAARPQKGLTYSELLMDNLIGLDNDYLSAGEQLGQQFNADELGFLKNAGISAYEGAKKAVTSPIETIQGVGDAIYGSGEDLFRGIDSKVQEMFGVGYDEATDEQITQARESLVGDVLNVSQLIPGAAVTKKGVGSLARGVPEAPLARRVPEAPPLTGDAAARAFETVAGNPNPLDRLPSLLDRVQRGEPLTEEEAFDVMTYERFGEDGVYDPTNTFDNWLQGTGGDTEAAARITFLTDPTNPQGLAEPVARQPGPYFDDIPAAFMQPPPDAPFLDIADMDAGPDIDDYDPSFTSSGLTRYEVRPTIGQAEGIAGLYSPTRKAVDLLDRPAYDNLDSLRVQLINRGAKPDELARLTGRLPGGPVSKDDLARLADEASQDVVVSTRTASNSRRDNPVFLDESYFLRGAEDIGANVFEAPVEIRTVSVSPTGVPGSFEVNRPSAPDEAYNHFKASSDTTAPVLHTRFGMFRSPGADKPDTYHLGEIQSDWAQTRQKLFPTREAFKEAEERYVEADNRLMDLVSQRRQMKKDWEQTYGALSSMDARFPNIPSIYEDAGYQALEKAAEKAREEVSTLGDKISLTQRNGTRDEFDANYPAPYVGTTSKWVQLGLRQSLLDAVNKGAKRMTLSTGEQAKGYTFGKEGGQSKFYDEIVPKELNEVLRKFAKEAGIQKPEITMSKIEGSRGQEYMVPTVEFTDEFVEALKRVGLPAYAKGGIVKGSYLDNDPLDPALY